MPLPIAVLLLISLLLVTGGCSESQTADSAGIAEDTTPSAPASLEYGAWLGQGTFTSTNGSQRIKAQLELLADGTYRFMVIEPRVLMMVVGLEKGKWERLNQELKLAPYQDQTSTGTGKLGALNRAPKNFRPKALKVDEDNLVLKDDQMDLLFQPNPEATEKLRQRGELR